MTRDKHLKKAQQIEKSLKKLLPDPKGEGVVAVVELTYGILQHLIAAGCEEKFSEHKDVHTGLAKFLRQHQEEGVAKIFEDLDKYRLGRWYGSLGNGQVIQDCLSFIKEVKAWIKKKD